MALNLKSEYKYICKDKEELKKMMQKEGFIFRESVRVHDDYLTGIDGNMLADETCLKIRNINDKEILLTFESQKDNLSNLNLKIMEKIRLDSSEYGNILSLMSSLGYYRYVGVNILKETYVQKSKEYYYYINVDYIENIGILVDYEIYTEGDNSNELENRFETFKEIISGVMQEYTSQKNRDYCSLYLYNNYYKGVSLKRILVEFEKIFIDINFKDIINSIRNKYTILNLELIEKMEQLGIKVDIIYSQNLEKEIFEVKEALGTVGYNTKLLNIKEIKEISVKETLIIEKQKTISFSEIALNIIQNIKK